jgi:hypothetical protein
MSRPLQRASSFVRLFSAAAAVVVLIGLVIAQGEKGGEKAGDKAKAGANKYIGSDKCKNCHQSEASGNQYGTWQKQKHAKAFETLAGDDAKKIAKEKGIDDPQKSDKCLKCHETAFGVAPEEIKKGFDVKQGVQCESCHGPGEQHMKTRMAAAAKAGGDEGFGDDKGKGKVAERQTLPAGEIIANVDAKTCLGCHNDESPNFKPFCFHKFESQIRHLDPRKTHGEKDVMDCGCGEKCGCTKGCDDKCGVPAKLDAKDKK